MENNFNDAAVLNKKEINNDLSDIVILDPKNFIDVQSDVIEYKLIDATNLNNKKSEDLYKKAFGNDLRGAIVLDLEELENDGLKENKSSPVYKKKSVKRILSRQLFLLGDNKYNMENASDNKK